MTCIVGLIDNGKVYIGADSQATAGYVKHTLPAGAAKVFKLGDMLIGCCGDVRGANILRYRFTPPAHHPPDMDDATFIATTVVDAMRACFKDAGASKIENSVEETGGSLFVIGYHNRLFRIGGDWSVFETAEPYMVTGSGQEFALGALYAGTGKTPKARIEKALEAAEKFDIYCRGPFVIEELSAA